jgi:S-adenosyl methyltransferase
MVRAARTLDFGRPVAIVLMAVLQFIADEEGVDGVVAQLLDAAAAGS